MDRPHLSSRQALRVAVVVCGAVALVGGGGGAVTASSPSGPATGMSSSVGPSAGASPGGAASGSVPAMSPSPTLPAVDVRAAERLVRRLIAAVNGDRYNVARSLKVAPDRWWSLDDMEAIRSIRLERVIVFRVEAPDAVMLQTNLTRDPPPMAGGPSWPNFMLVVRDASGAWRVAETATGP